MVPGLKFNIWVPKYGQILSQLSDEQSKPTVKITGDFIWHYNCCSIKKMLEFKTNQEKCSVQDSNVGLKQKSQENRAFLCPFLPAFAIFWNIIFLQKSVLNLNK